MNEFDKVLCIIAGMIACIVLMGGGALTFFAGAADPEGRAGGYALGGCAGVLAGIVGMVALAWWII